jgi:predicted metal-dependent HD superfamily phosphohydrolase
MVADNALPARENPPASFSGRTNVGASGLRAAWQRMWRGVGAAGGGEALYDELVACYAQPWRHYHSRQHLGECLQWFESAAALAERPAEVEAALWFHDAVYDIGSQDNEERSAAWARTALLAASVPHEAAGRIERLVLATRHTTPPEEADAQLLVDIDLSILGAAQPRFAEYQRQIRQEYAAVAQEQFRARRREILSAFLERPQIYSTAHFRLLLEDRARANLRLAVAQNAP